MKNSIIKIKVNIKIEIISKMRMLSSKLENVKNKSPYENDDPINEMRKLSKSNLLDHPQMMSLDILAKTIHSYR